MLTRLGYEIVLENESINCQKEEHHQKTHGIDFLARPGKQLVRKPVNAPDGLTLFSCKHGSVGDREICDTRNINECLKLSDKYKDLKGAVLVTGAWVPRDVREKMRGTDGLYLWDQARCHLYGNLARHYVRLDVTSKASADRIWSIEELDTTIVMNLVQKDAGYFGLFNYCEVGVFYEGDERFNLELLREILRRLRDERIVRSLSLNRLVIHTTRGFTDDFSSRMNDVLKSSICRFVGIRCSLSDLYDHSNPWFPSYMR